MYVTTKVFLYDLILKATSTHKYIWIVFVIRHPIVKNLDVASTSRHRTLLFSKYYVWEKSFQIAKRLDFLVYLKAENTK